ncbi:MAG: RCC1 domain-containing protein, partial [Bacteroidia bacterium]
MVNSLSGVIAIAGGWEHSLALKNDGTVWAWGDNTYGQLGNGTYTNSNVPVQVVGLTGVIAIAGGSPWNYLALKNDGTVWGWGYNSYGQLGDGTNINRNIPVQVSSVSSIIAIAAGYEYSIALKNDGSVLAWGSNSFGQLGNGTNLSSNIPVPVNSLTGIIFISAGGGTSIALKNDETIWSWGNNAEGELGNGNNTNSNTPLQTTGTCQILATLNEIQDQPIISVSPNPSTGNFTVNLKNTTVATQICVYDVFGNCLWNKSCRNETSPKIDISSQPKGIYFMEIVSDNKRSVNKIVLQ